MSVPPLFGNYGKSTSDLFKKKFDFDPIQLKSIQKSKANGVSVENGAVAVVKANKDKSETRYLRGYNKFSLSRASFGTADLELHTDVSQTSKVQVKLTKLQPGLALTLAATSNDKAALFKGDKVVASVDATYSRPYVNTQLIIKSDLAKPKLKIDGSASFGVHDNVSVGASFSTSHGGATKITDVQEAQLGGEYSQNDLTVSVFTSTEMKDDGATQFLNGSYFQNISRDFTQGAAWKYNLKAKSHEVTLGSDVRLGPDTGLKSKIVLPKGTWQLAVEQRLTNPQLLLGVATEFDVATPHAPVSKNFGVSLTFGEF